MNNKDLKAAILRAIESANEQDERRAEQSPRYADDLVARRLHRADIMLAHLAGGVSGSEPELEKLIVGFLNDPLPNTVAATRHLATSETFSHPAPGTKG